jgi:hypothetical protein
MFVLKFEGFKLNMYYETQNKNSANHPHYFKLTAVKNYSL